MKSAEYIILDNLKTQLLAQPSDSQSILITKLYSQEFINALKDFRKDHTYTHASLQDTGRQKFDIIIDWKANVSSIDDITAYKKHLKQNGAVALGLPSQARVQQKVKRPTFYLLTEEADEKLHVEGFTTIFREPIGKLRHIHRLAEDGVINNFLSKRGKAFPNLKFYSPYNLCIYTFLSSSQEPYKPYISVHTLANKMARLRKRIVYKVQNHKINDYILKANRFFITLVRLFKTVFFIHRYQFKKRVIPSIPVLKINKSRKVLVIVMTYLQIGGVERVMLNLIKGIDRTKFSIHLITTVPSHNEWHEVFLPYADTIIHAPNELDSSWPEVYRQHYLEEYIIRNNADVLFITNSSSGYHALPNIKKKLPKLAVYDLLHTHGTPRDHDAYLKISLPFDKYINRRIVIDEYLKSYYCEKYPINPTKVSVIYNSIDTETLNFKPNIKNKEPFFNDLPTDKKIITYVGRLEFDKSPFRLVYIAAALKEQEVAACIVVIGDGTLRESMINEARKLAVLNDYIFFYGSSQAPLQQMAQSDFTLLVSNAEGIPMSILESMSIQVPAISSAVGGVPEIISDEEDGLLVTILDTSDETVRIERFTQSIAHATRLDTEHVNRMKKSARQKIIDRFSSMSTEYEHLFETGKVK